MVVAKENAKDLVQEIVLVVVAHLVCLPANNNVLVLVGKYALMGVVQNAEVDVLPDAKSCA